MFHRGEVEDEIVGRRLLQEPRHHRAAEIDGLEAELGACGDHSAGAQIADELRQIILAHVHHMQRARAELEGKTGRRGADGARTADDQYAPVAYRRRNRRRRGSEILFEQRARATDDHLLQRREGRHVADLTEGADASSATAGRSRSGSAPPMRAATR
jgi:hypothetical protein